MDSSIFANLLVWMLAKSTMWFSTPRKNIQFQCQCQSFPSESPFGLLGSFWWSIKYLVLSGLENSREKTPSMRFLAQIEILSAATFCLCSWICCSCSCMQFIFSRFEFLKTSIDWNSLPHGSPQLFPYLHAQLKWAQHCWWLPFWCYGEQINSKSALEMSQYVKHCCKPYFNVLSKFGRQETQKADSSHHMLWHTLRVQWMKAHDIPNLGWMT